MKSTVFGVEFGDGIGNDCNWYIRKITIASVRNRLISANVSSFQHSANWFWTMLHQTKSKTCQSSWNFWTLTTVRRLSRNFSGLRPSSIDSVLECGILFWFAKNTCMMLSPNLLVWLWTLWYDLERYGQFHCTAYWYLGRHLENSLLELFVLVSRWFTEERTRATYQLDWESGLICKNCFYGVQFK